MSGLYIIIKRGLATPLERPNYDEYWDALLRDTLRRIQAIYIRIFVRWVD